jgi:hypothetical protein
MHQGMPQTTEAIGAKTSVTAEALLPDRLRALVRERPLLVTIAAGAVGATLGGLLLARLARLVFLGAVGFVLSDVLRGGDPLEALLPGREPSR